MRTWLTILGGLLALQVALALGLWLGDGDDAALAEGKPLAQFSRDAVQAIEITGGDDTQVRLERGDDGWRIPAADGFPAAQSDIEALLEGLDGFADRLPVARSEAARERFRVADEQFERRVRLIGSDGPVATVLLGQSAGPDQVYARAGDGSMIYEVGFALRQASGDPTQWYDSDVADVSLGDVMEVRLADFRLRRGDADGAWLALPDGGQVQPVARGKATQLVGQVAGPALEGVARANAPSRASDLAYTITTRAGETVDFAYYREAEGDGVRLYRGDQPWRYRISADTFDRIAGASVEGLLPGQSDGDDPSQGGAAGAGS